MEGNRLLRRLRLTNFLSYGLEGEDVELQPLNVLIGPNGSGKSNFIEAIALLRALPTNLASAVRSGGGIAEWFHIGDSRAVSPSFELKATVSYPPSPIPLVHQLTLQHIGQQVFVERETFDNEFVPPGADPEQHWYYKHSVQSTSVNAAEYLPGQPIPVRRSRELGPKERTSSQSMLSQLRDPHQYPELTYLADRFSEIAVFRVSSLGPGSQMRGPQRADESAAFLVEDGRNLGVVLNDLLSKPPTRKLLLAKLKLFCERIEDVATKVVAGTVEVLAHERGLDLPILSTRLSDGTLRYLFLLAILCHPEPPSLVCIEEPEIGMHPDVLPVIADLLTEASQRMQLIVTTHSDILVSALSEVPEAVVVCERDDEGTHLRHLDAARLEEWLKKYSLGNLWISGEIGGTT